MKMGSRVGVLMALLAVCMLLQPRVLGAAALSADEMKILRGGTCPHGVCLYYEMCNAVGCSNAPSRCSTCNLSLSQSYCEGSQGSGCVDTPIPNGCGERLNNCWCLKTDIWGNGLCHDGTGCDPGTYGDCPRNGC